MNWWLPLLAFVLCGVSSAEESKALWHDGAARFYTREAYEEYERGRGGDASWLGPVDPKATKERAFIILADKPALERLMVVWLDTKTKKLKGWRGGAKVNCDKRTVADSVFTRGVREGRTQCTIKIAIVATYPDGSPAELELSGLTWRENPNEDQQAQQGGAGQPATAPESKSEDKKNSKPEAEGRSQ